MKCYVFHTYNFIQKFEITVYNDKILSMFPNSNHHLIEVELDINLVFGQNFCLYVLGDIFFENLTSAKKYVFSEEKEFVVVINSCMYKKKRNVYYAHPKHDATPFSAEKYMRCPLGKVIKVKTKDYFDTIDGTYFFFTESNEIDFLTEEQIFDEIMKNMDRESIKKYILETDFDCDYFEKDRKFFLYKLFGYMESNYEIFDAYEKYIKLIEKIKN